jgi:hypothetical protein
VSVHERKPKETRMVSTRTTGDAQTTRWHGLAGRVWVAWQEGLDQRCTPLAARLVDAVVVGSGYRVRTVAQRLGAPGRGIGIDISNPMITAARDHTPASVLRANAPTHAVAPARVDMRLSRFGVMCCKGR